VILILFLLIISTNTFAEQSVNNLLINSDFETGSFLGWQVKKGTTADIVENPILKGNYALALTGDLNKYSEVKQSFDIALKGSKYVFQGAVAVLSNAKKEQYPFGRKKFQFTVTWYDAKGKILQWTRHHKIPIKSEYNYITFEGIAPFDAVTGELAIRANLIEGVAYFDDLTLVHVPSDTTEDVRILSISPSPVIYGDQVTFNGINSINNQDMPLYQWHSNIDGILSGKSAFSRSDLSIGDHTISFKVKDELGEWSSEAVAYLSVRESIVNNENILNNSDFEFGNLYHWNKPSVNTQAKFTEFQGLNIVSSLNSNDQFDLELSSESPDLFQRINIVEEGHIYKIGMEAKKVEPIETSGFRVIIKWYSMNGYVINQTSYYEKISSNIRKYEREVKAPSGAVSAKFVLSCLCENSIYLDNFKFVDQSKYEGNVPEAKIVQLTPQLTDIGIEQYFSGVGTTIDDEITQFRWRSDRDGYLSSQKDFSFSLLSPGTHIIFFKVANAKGIWSPEVSQLVTIDAKEEHKFNLLVNPDFDEGMKGWKFTKNATGTVYYPVFPKSNVFSLRVKNNSYGAAYQKIDNVVSGRRYRFEAWYSRNILHSKDLKMGKAGIFVRWFDMNGFEIKSSNFDFSELLFSNINGYGRYDTVRVATDLTAPLDAKSVNIELKKRNTPHNQNASFSKIGVYKID